MNYSNKVGKISVFGATGFVGQNFVYHFPEESLVIPRENLTSETPNILYFVGTNHNYNIFANPKLDISVNLEHLIDVLESSRRAHGNLNITYISTWFVYGNSQLPYQEHQSCRPRGFYSITKYAAEMLLESYCQTYDLNFKIIRLGNVFGSGDKNASEKKNALQYLVQKIRTNEDVQLYENGEVQRDFIHNDDVARGIDLILRRGRESEIYNLGSGYPTLLGPLLKEYAQRIGSKSKFIEISTPNFHKIVQVRNAYLDTSKVSSLGFQIKKPISAQALEEV
jgi:nucleoside-diphosphate-sugar epimerase